MVGEETKKKLQFNEEKDAEAKRNKLLKAFQNNLKISELNLPNKFSSFEKWELDKSNRLLYEIERNKKTYKRFPKGSIIKVDFGVNVGGEFSEQHFAITLNKKDNMFNNVITVIPLTSKEHKNTLDLGKLIVDMYLNNLQKELDSLQEKIQEIDIENCEFNPDFSKNIKEIEKILSYYKKTRKNLSYACVDQIRTVSKLNVLPAINQYDIVGKSICTKEVMDKLDLEIIRRYIGLDMVEVRSKIIKETIK